MIRELCYNSPMNEAGKWQSVSDLASRAYTCGHCGSDISSQKAFYSKEGTYTRGTIYVCHRCNKPTYFTAGGTQTPGALLGGNIEHLPEDIARLYAEIRNATTTNSYTAAVLAARKLLMHIAVDQGADAGKKFITYVNYLAENGFTPPNARAWVDEIRNLGNEANHEIVIMDEQKAKTIIKFIEMLLKFNYEFPAEVSMSEVSEDNG